MTHLRSPHDAYELLKQIGDGSFGTVYKARHKESRKPVAIKVMKKKYNSLEDCEDQFEPKLLHLLPKHPNIVEIHDSFLTETTHDLSFVMEYMDSGNLYQLMRERKDHHIPFNSCELRNILYQVLSAVSHIHHHNIFHRDMKPENLLLDYSTGWPVIKLADFGLAREIDSKPPFTEYVSTRWYRAPEVLLRSTEYSAAVDLWALGAIFAELITFEPLFPGDSEIDQIYKICEILGSPGNKIGVIGQKSTRLLRPEKRPSPGFAKKKVAEAKTVEKGTLSTMSVLDGGGEWKEGVKLAHKIGFKFPHLSPKPLNSVIQNATEPVLDIIKHFLFFNPHQRRSAHAALKHSFFTETDTSIHTTKTLNIPSNTLNILRFTCPEWNSEDRDSFYGRLCSDIDDDRLSNVCATNVDRLVHNPENDGYLSQTRPIYSSHEKVHPLIDQEHEALDHESYLSQKRNIYSSHEKTHPVSDRPGSSQTWNKYNYSQLRSSTAMVDRIHSSRGLTSSSGKHSSKKDDPVEETRKRLSGHLLLHHNDYHLRNHHHYVKGTPSSHYYYPRDSEPKEVSEVGMKNEGGVRRPVSRLTKRLSSDSSTPPLSPKSGNHSPLENYEYRKSWNYGKSDYTHPHSHLLNSWGPQDEEEKKGTDSEEQDGKDDFSKTNGNKDRWVHVL